MDPLTDHWIEALERRHLADLTRREVARALSALSSCYVQRRAKLAEGGALSSAGKRAAFALFYGPQHLLVTRRIVESLPVAEKPSAESSISGAVLVPRVSRGPWRRGRARFAAWMLTPGQSRRPTGPTVNPSSTAAPSVRTLR